jgi:hypothetical protein
MELPETFLKIDKYRGIYLQLKGKKGDRAVENYALVGDISTSTEGELPRQLSYI